MGRRAGTFTLCVGSLSLLFLLATDSLEGLGLPSQPLDPFKDSHLIRHRILAHMKELAASYVKVPAMKTFSYPATGCWKTADAKERMAMVLQFPRSLRAFLRSNWGLERAVLQGPNLQKNTSFHNCTLSNITLDFTNSTEKTMQDCKDSSERYRFSLKVRTTDLFGRNGNGDLCVVETTKRSHMRRSLGRSPGRSCDICRPRPFRVNLSEFVNGFHPDNIGPDGRTELYYCMGDCIHADCLEEPTPWLSLAIFMHRKNTAFRGPSCDPVAFANITGVLVHPDRTPCAHNLSNIVVTKCRCL